VIPASKKHSSSRMSFCQVMWGIDELEDRYGGVMRNIHTSPYFQSGHLRLG
jgi:hypothetical protein